MPDVPEWMTQPESYDPPKDRERFLDKSILGFMGLLSKIRQQGRTDRDRLWVSPFFKLVFTVFFIVLVSLSRSFAFLYVMLAYLVVLLALLPGECIKPTLRNAVVAGLFTYLIMLPSALHGNSYSITMIPVKVFESITAIGILSTSTRWDHLIASFKRFFVPDLFIFVFDLMIKYMVLLGEYALQMLYALKLRSVGRNKSKYGSLSGVGGMLFVKSRALSREMVHAMECRGFDGKYPVTDKFRFTVYDAAFLLLNGGILWLFLHFQALV